MFERLIYQARNWRAHWRALVMGTSLRVSDSIRVYGRLDAVLLRADGTKLDLGCVGRRVITTVGGNFMRDDFNGGGAVNDITLMNFHDSGTGVAAEAIGDTDLGTPAGPVTRATGTQSAPASLQYRSVGLITYTGALAITEHGLFNQAARGAGSVLWDRTTFAAINVVNTDAIQFTYTLTITVGG